MSILFQNAPSAPQIFTVPPVLATSTPISLCSDLLSFPQPKPQVKPEHALAVLGAAGTLLVQSCTRGLVKQHARAERLAKDHSEEAASKLPPKLASGGGTHLAFFP